MSLKEILSLLSGKPQAHGPTPVEKLLTAELESRKRLTDAALAEIKHVSDTHDRLWKWFFWIEGVAIGIVFFFVGKTVYDANKTLSKVTETSNIAVTNAQNAVATSTNVAVTYAQNAVAEMRTNIEQQLVSMRSNMNSDMVTLSTSLKQEMVSVDRRSKEELTNQFGSEKIQNLVHAEAKDRIDAIADPLISSNITVKIEPRLKEIDANLAESNKKLKDIDSNLLDSNKKLAESDQKADELRKLIAQADNALKQLNESSDFLQKTVLADHDDRNAFEALLNICNNPTNKYQSDAIAITQRIRLSYFYRHNRVYVNVPWSNISGGTTRNSWTMSDIERCWTNLPTQFAADYVRYVSGHTNLLKEQKVWFFRNAYLNNSRNSLQAADEAANNAATLLNVTYNPPFEYTSIETAWKDYIQTNHIYNIDNNSTNLVYDLIHSSDTNRFGIVKNLGKTKVALLKLRFPPKGTIEGKWISYKTGEIPPLSYRVYLNLVSALFDSDSYEDTKFEFKYEADTTRTNVYSHNITPDLLNDNGSFNVDRVRSELGQ